MAVMFFIELVSGNWAMSGVFISYRLGEKFICGQRGAATRRVGAVKYGAGWRFYW
jgi:hypothetical protein